MSSIPINLANTPAEVPLTASTTQVVPNQLYSLRAETTGAFMPVAVPCLTFPTAATENTTYVLQLIGKTYKLIPSSAVAFPAAPTNNTPHTLTYDLSAQNYKLTSTLPIAAADTTTLSGSYNLLWDAALQKFTIDETPHFVTPVNPINSYVLRWNGTSYSLTPTLVEDASNVDRSVDKAYGLTLGAGHFNIAETPRIGFPTTLPSQSSNYSLNWNPTTKKYTLTPTPRFETPPTVLPSATTANYLLQWDQTENKFAPTAAAKINPTSLIDQKVYELQWGDTANEFTAVEKTTSFVKPANPANSYLLTWDPTTSQYVLTTSAPVSTANLTNQKDYQLRWNSISKTFTGVEVPPAFVIPASPAGNYALHWNASNSQFTLAPTALVSTASLTNQKDYQLRWNTSTNTFTGVEANETFLKGGLLGHNRTYKLKYDSGTQRFTTEYSHEKINPTFFGTDNKYYTLLWSGGRFEPSTTCRIIESTKTADKNYLLKWHSYGYFETEEYTPSPTITGTPTNTKNYQLQWNAPTNSYDIQETLAITPTTLTDQKDYQLRWNTSTNSFTGVEADEAFVKGPFTHDGLTYKLKYDASTQKYATEYSPEKINPGFVGNDFSYYTFEWLAGRLQGRTTCKIDPGESFSKTADKYYLLKWHSFGYFVTDEYTPSHPITGVDSSSNGKNYILQWNSTANEFQAEETRRISAVNLSNGLYALRWNAANDRFDPESTPAMGSTATNNSNHVFQFDLANNRFNPLETQRIEVTTLTNGQYHVLKWDSAGKKLLAINSLPIASTSLTHQTKYQLQWNGGNGTFVATQPTPAFVTPVSPAGNYALHWDAAASQFTLTTTTVINTTGLTNNKNYQLQWDSTTNSFTGVEADEAFVQGPYTNDGLTYKLKYDASTQKYITEYSHEKINPTFFGTDNKYYTLLWSGGRFEPSTTCRIIESNKTADKNYLLKWHSYGYFETEEYTPNHPITGTPTNSTNYILQWSNNQYQIKNTRLINTNALTDQAYYNLQWDNSSQVLTPKPVIVDHALGVSYATGETVNRRTVYIRHFETTTPATGSELSLTLDTATVWSILDYGGTVSDGRGEWHMMQDSFTRTGTHMSIFYIENDELKIFINQNMLINRYRNRDARLWVRYVKN